MEYLITGGAGFIGSKFAEYLKNKKKYIAVDDFSKGKLENIIEMDSFLKFDCSSEEFEQWLTNQKPKHIIHLCGQSSGERSFNDPTNDFLRNVLTTRRVLSGSVNNEQLKSISLSSSMAVYGNKLNAKETDKIMPISWYGRHKYIAETLLEEFANKYKNVNCNSIRLFNVYGNGQDLDDLKQGMISIFISMAVRNKEISVRGPGSRLRDFIHINDVIRGIDLIVNREKGNNYEAFNLGTGEFKEISEVVNFIASLSSSEIIYLDERTPNDQDYCSLTCQN